MPIPELILTSIFSELSPANLLATTKNPVTKAWRKYGLVEIFKRNAPEFWFFVARYIDYQFKHRSVIARSEFVELLDRSGILSRLDQLTKEQLSLLFGIFHPRYRQRQLVISASLGLDYSADTALLCNAIISVYCFASSEKVRDILFIRLVSELWHDSTDSEFGKERATIALQKLAEYLSPKHLRLFNKLKLCNSSDNSTWFGKNGCAWMVDDISAAALQHRMSEAEKLSLLTKFLEGNLGLEEQLIFKKIVRFYGDINLNEKLSADQFNRLCQKLKNLQPFKINNAYLFLVIHKQIPKINDSIRYMYLICIYNSFPELVYDYEVDDLSIRFIELFKILPEGCEIQSDADRRSYTQYGFMFEILTLYQSTSFIFNSTSLDCFRLQSFQYLSNHLKQYAFKSLMLNLDLVAQSKPAVVSGQMLTGLMLNLSGVSKSLFLLARIAKGLDEKQINQFFELLLKKIDCKIDKLIDSIDDNCGMNVLIILFELNEKIPEILSYPTKLLIEQSIQRSMLSLNYAFFICAYRPKLTAEQRTQALLYLKNSKVHPIEFYRQLIELGRNMKPKDISIFHEINQTKHNRLYQILTEAMSDDHPIFTSREIISNAILNLNLGDNYDPCLFKSQLNTTSSKLSSCVDAIQSGEVTVAEGYMQLIKQAEALNLHDLLEVLHERSLIDLRIQRQYSIQSIRPNFAS